MSRRFAHTSRTSVKKLCLKEKKRHGTDLETRTDVAVEQTLTQQGMADVDDRIDDFGLQVLDADKVLDLQRVELDEDVLVDGGGKNEAAVLFIV